jgi:DNA repair exonuclease SbcCD ATPase subunit
MPPKKASATGATAL